MAEALSDNARLTSVCLRPDVRDRQIDRQTSDVRQHHRLMPRGRGHNRQYNTGQLIDASVQCRG